MGISVSKAEAAAPPAVRGSTGGAGLLPPTAAAVVKNVQTGTVSVACDRPEYGTQYTRSGLSRCVDGQGAGAKPAELIDYTRLPPPIKYEELQRESMSTLTISICSCMPAYFTEANGTQNSAFRVQ